MGTRFRALLSTVCGLVLLTCFLLMLGSLRYQGNSAALHSSQRGEAGYQQAEASNSTSCRPLYYALSADPVTLDINLATDTTSHMVLDQLMEGLYRYRTDGSVDPAGAISHTVSSDGRVYTVTLRSDARWSDGQLVTAQHYVDGIIRLLSPEIGASYAWTMYLIEGAQDFNSGAITDPEAVGVTAVDSDTLRFTLTGPAAHFSQILAMSTSYPVRLDIINGNPQWTEAGHFVGNGPYVLTQWDHGNRLILDKNPQYHGGAEVSIEQVIFPIIPFDNDALAAYENDQLDASGYPSSEVARILSDPALSAELRRTPRPGIYYLGLNTQLTPTTNVSVRRALASAIDRRHIINDVVDKPWLSALTGVIPPGIPGYQGEAVGYTFNVTQAQTYLAEAGYPGGVGFPGIELWYNAGEYNALVLESVAQQWRDNLGINVATFSTGFSDYLDLLGSCSDNPGSCSYNAYRMGWLMDYADASNVLDLVFHPDSPFHQTGWDNSRYRQLMSMAATETNQALRTAYFEEADRILVEDEAAVIPIHGYDRSLLVKSDIVFQYPPFGSPHFMKWEIINVVTATITPTGGIVRSADGDIRVEFPENAVANTTNVTYTVVCAPTDPPAGTFAFAGNAFSLDVVDIASGKQITDFAEHPLTITIDYTDGDLNGVDEKTLELRYWDGNAWSKDGVTIVERDATNNQVVLQAEHLTEFALLGKHRVHLPLVLRDG